MGNEPSVTAKVKQSGVVIVTDKKEEEPKEDQHIAQLSFCPTFRPLLETSLSIPESRPLKSELVRNLDNNSCVRLCIHLQDHLENCSETVKADQIALASRIKEVEKFAFSVMLKLTERQKAFAKHAQHTRKLEDISTTLKKLNTNLQRTLDLTNELNMLLPDGHRLERFTL